MKLFWWHKIIDFARNRSMRLSRRRHPPAVGYVQFGSLRQVTPISFDWGLDRGFPIDRYYIENFLANHKEDVRGRVLEIGDNAYTRRFGGDRVAISDVLQVRTGASHATIIADLSSADHILSNTFDCIILTQTLQLIYDVRAALKTICRILKPGGVLLATFPGISQTYDCEWGDSWYWNFTNLSARRLFEETFPAASVKVEAFGNVLAAISFLHGLAVEELSPEELDHREPGYDVTITVRAVKPEEACPVSAVNKLPQVARRLSSSFNAKVFILMYHRVASALSDPWSLCVSSQRFAQQLEVLRKHTQIMRLQDLTEVFDKAAISRPSVVVTFDDGYANNFHHVRPLLEWYGVPATIFITSGYLGTEHEFWWDELERLLLQPGILPKRLHLTVSGSNYEWELGGGSDYNEHLFYRHRFWRAWEEPPTSRQSLYVSLWQILQRLRHEERQSVLGELSAWANLASTYRETHRPLSFEELSELAKGDLIEIGSHTVTHSALSTLSVAAQREEIQRSKKCLEDISGRPITSFAYPYGSKRDYTIDTVRLVEEAGFDCACSTSPTVVTKDSSQFELPRLQVQDWDGDEFSRQLSLWFDA